MPTTPFAIAAFVLGAVVGSFLNVVIYRLPAGLSIVHPRSRCPRCGTPIRALHNIPIISYLWLRGKCAACRAPFSLRYPLVEALMGILSALLWLRVGASAAFPIYFLFLSGLVAVTFIDLDHRIIPDRLSLGGIAVGFACSFFLPLGWLDSLVGIAAGSGSLFAVAWTFEKLTGKEGMGLGDVKLIGAIGAFLGWEAVLFTIFTSALAGAAVGIVFVNLSGRGRNYQIPYGPFLAAGAALYLFRGVEIITWYLGFQG